MAIHALGLEFDGIDDDRFMLCNFEDPSSSNDEEVDIMTDKSSANDEWDLLGVSASSPLKFPITLVKKDNSWIDSYDERRLKKWLMLYTRYAWLKVFQDDLSEIHYKCLITYSSTVKVGGNVAGITFNVNCNSIVAWSPEIKKTYSVSDSVGTFNFMCDSDFRDKLVYPKLTITSNTNGTIKITNITENNRVTQIDNCTVGEIITMDCQRDIFESSTNRNIIKNFNGNFFELLDSKNVFKIEGNCTVIMTFRYQRRVGA